MKVKFLKDSLYALDKVNSVSAKKVDIIDMPTILAETYIAKDLEKSGYPTHIMYADAFDDRVESWDATSERLDEFFKLRRLL